LKKATLARLKVPQTKHHFEDLKIYSYNQSLSKIHMMNQFFLFVSLFVFIGENEVLERLENIHFKWKPLD
jgi:hypothetical protein